MDYLERLREWREATTFEADLGGGLIVLGRKVELPDLVINGGLPAPLLAMIEEARGDGEVKERDIDLADPEGLKLFEGFRGMLDAICLAGIVAPPIKQGPGGEDHLGLDELSFSQKQRFYEKSVSGVAGLVKFQPEPGQPDPTGSDGSEVRDPAQ